MTATSDTAGPQHPPALAGRGHRVGHVVEHVRSEHQVEGGGRNGKALHVGLYDRRVVDVGEHAGGEVQGHPQATVAPLVHGRLVGAVAAAHVEDALVAARGHPGEIEDPGEQIEAGLTAA